MSKLSPDQIRIIVATDCGSTTTKAILIQKIDGQYRQTHRGEAPTMVEEPLADVTLDVIGDRHVFRRTRAPHVSRRF